MPSAGCPGGTPGPTVTVRMGGSTCAAGRSGPLGCACASAHPAAIPGACGRQVAPEENEAEAAFTGIVEELGEAVALEGFQGSARLSGHGPLVAAAGSAGGSVAIHGACLTV